MVIPTSRIGIYVRVSTSDKDQNPATQLLPLREFAYAQGWLVAGEFIDHASATDLRGCTQWQAVLQAASKRKIDLVLVWKLDRAFRSVLHASSTLEELRRWGVGVRSYSEPWADTTSAQGELVFNLLTTFAQFERSLIAERVRAERARAKKQGTRLGRPRGINGGWSQVRPLIESGMSQRKAPQVLGVGTSPVSRLLRLLSRNGSGNRTPRSLI